MSVRDRLGIPARIVHNPSPPLPLVESLKIRGSESMFVEVVGQQGEVFMMPSCNQGPASISAGDQAAIDQVGFAVEQAGAGTGERHAAAARQASPRISQIFCPSRIIDTQGCRTSSATSSNGVVDAEEAAMLASTVRLTLKRRS